MAGPAISPAVLEALGQEENHATSAFADGLFLTLKPAIEDVDAGIRSVLESQDSLGGHIDRLTSGLRLPALHASPVCPALNEFTDTVKMPPALAPYTTKLVNSRKRLKRVNESVLRINQRLDEMRTTIRRREAITPAPKRPAAAPAKPSPVPSSAPNSVPTSGSSAGTGTDPASGPESKATPESAQAPDSKAQASTSDNDKADGPRNESSGSGAGTSTAAGTESRPGSSVPASRPVTVAALMDVLDWD